MLNVGVIAGNALLQELSGLIHSTGLAATVTPCQFARPDLFQADPLGQAAVDVIFIEVPREETLEAVGLIEMLRDLFAEAHIIALGDLNDSPLIVSTMRAGARDFLGLPVDRLQLREALAKLDIGQNSSAGLGKITLVVGGKGGSGATMVAVNTAVSLLAYKKKVLLADFGLPGNVACQLKLEPEFTLSEVLRNLHRIDTTLLGSFTTEHRSGLHVLAGVTQPETDFSEEALLRIGGLLRHIYEHIIIDVSADMRIARALAPMAENILLVAQPEVASIWNTIQVRKYLSQVVEGNMIKLVLNRYRKLETVSLRELENAVGAAVLCTVPNQFHAVNDAAAVGLAPCQNGGELAACFNALAAGLAGAAVIDDKSSQRRKTLLSRLMSIRSAGTVEVEAEVEGAGVN